MAENGNWSAEKLSNDLVSAAVRAIADPDFRDRLVDPAQSAEAFQHISGIPLPSDYRILFGPGCLKPESLGPEHFIPDDFGDDSTGVLNVGLPVETEPTEALTQSQYEELKVPKCPCPPFTDI